MTLDEAIRHCLEQARKLQDKADKVDGDESRQCIECAADHIQLADWLIELKEAKRLLKAAVEDMNSNNICFDLNACNVCADSKCIQCDTFKWRYTDEALKLIGGSEDG